MISLNLLLPTSQRFTENESACAIEFISALWDALPIDKNMTSSITETAQCDICLSSHSRTSDQHLHFLRVPAPISQARSLNRIVLDALQEQVRPNPPVCSNTSCPALGSELPSSIHLTPRQSLSIFVERLAITYPLNKRVTTPVLEPTDSSLLFGDLRLTGVIAYDTTHTPEGTEKKHWIFFKLIDTPHGPKWYKLDSQIGHPVSTSPFNDQSDHLTLDMFTFTKLGV